MKSVYSSSDNSVYDFFIPIAAYSWKRLSVDSIVFVPEAKSSRLQYCINTSKLLYPEIKFYDVKCLKHKESTFLQCSRLYAAALDLPEDEVLVTSDVDMGVFTRGIFDTLTHHLFNDGVDISILGSDLVPDKQLPMCYLIGKAGRLSEIYGINGRTYQQCLDDLLGDIDSTTMRSDYWAKDQEEAWERIYGKYRDEHNPYKVGYALRTNGQNQFATKRLDRDDAYLLERLNPDIIDFHMGRPGYTEENFNTILTVLRYFYPSENFDWLIEYRDNYIKLI